MLAMSSYRLRKTAVAIGGFLIFVGIIMMGMFALVFFGVVDVGLLEGTLMSEEYRTLSSGALLIIGVLDLVVGIMLRRR